MTYLILIVSEASGQADPLLEALAPDETTVEACAPAAALGRRWSPDAAPDVLLVDASLDIEMVHALTAHVRAAADRSPAVVSFTHGDFDDMESHTRAGLDFLVPPFMPHLVHRRVDVARAHRDLGSAVADMRHQRYERELQIGREIQRGFLPETLPQIDNWDIAAYFEPAREVSGDFYDAYDVVGGNLMAFAIADVCDKGIGAALFMALIRSLLRLAAATEAARADVEPDAGAPRPLAGARLVLHAVQTTNDYLTANHLHQAYFATLFFGVVDPDTGELVYINCGHNPPIISRAAGEQVSLEPTGPALGLMSNALFDLGHLVIKPGDLLFLYTDGVLEAKSPDGEFFGEERMRDIISTTVTAECVVDRVSRAVVTHTGCGEQFDDVTMLGLHRLSDRSRGRSD